MIYLRKFNSKTKWRKTTSCRPKRLISSEQERKYVFEEWTKASNRLT